MMETIVAHAATEGSSVQPSGLGHSDEEHGAPQCNEKPRFSYGQLLTDQDLTALVDWTDRKARLAHDGWGVVRGLDVYASGQDGEVRLGTGHAVDSRGRDIVVCNETAISLEMCLKAEPVACLGVATVPAEAAQQMDFGGITVGNVRVFDLYLHYREVDQNPRATLGGGNGGGTAVCEYSRTRETFSVRCSASSADVDPKQSAADVWESGYRECLKPITRYRSECGAAQGGEIVRWLERWLSRHPLRQFSFLKDWITQTPAEQWNEALAAQALFWIVQDCRNQYLHCGVPDNATDSGVPVARVWVQPPEAGIAKAKPRVVAVDVKPPYRRPVQSDCWPAPSGSVNLGSLIWRRANEVQVEINRWGMHWKDPEEFSIPETVGALEDALNDSRIMLFADDQGKLQILNCGQMGVRIVGIR